MKSAFTLLVLLWCGVVSAANYTNTVATSANFQTVLNLTTNGDNVFLVGGNYVFSGPVVTNNYAITIQPVSNGVFFVDSKPNATRQNGDGSATLFLWVPTSNFVARLTGITWTNDGVNTIVAFDGALRIGGTSTTIRIDHCNFMSVVDLNIAWKGPPAGCVDHCTNRMERVNWLEVSQNGFGMESWATPAQWGTTNAVYAEYNKVYTNAGINNVAAFNDLYSGGRMVIRYNDIEGPFIQNHGTETGGDERSGFSLECYSNYMNGPGGGPAFYIRGGSARIWGNTITNWPILANFFNFRQEDPFLPWGYANGTNQWDLTNGISMVASGTHTGASGVQYLEDSNAAFTVQQFLLGYEIMNLDNGRWNQSGSHQAAPGSSAIGSNSTTRVYYLTGANGSLLFFTNGNHYQIWGPITAVLDQVGYGAGDLVNDNGGAPFNTVTGLRSWTHESFEGWYQWSNYINGAITTLPAFTNYNWDGASASVLPYTTIQLGRDYFNSAPTNSYTPLGPNPLDSNPASRIARVTTFRAGKAVVGP